MRLFRKKQKSIKKYLDNHLYRSYRYSPVALFLMIKAYYGFRLKKIEGEHITFYFADKCDSADNTKQEYHITLNYDEFIKLVEIILAIRRKIKVFLLKENRYRTIADELNSLFGNERKSMFR